MTKILVTGATSRAASRLGESRLWQENDLQLIAPGHSDLDVTNLHNLEEKIATTESTYVINFAGITDLNVCEAERGNQEGHVWGVNVQGTQNLARLSKKYHFHLIQLSTASVFAGEKENPGPYLETAAPESDDSKLSWYGLTKLASEKIVQNEAETWSIIRLASTVRSSVSSKQCLFRRWVSQYQDGTLPSLFDDQKLTTTDLTDLDAALALIIKKDLAGIYHVASPDLQTPYAIAMKLLNRFAKNSQEIKKSSLTEEIQKGNEKLKLFCPQWWGLDAKSTAQKLGVSFNTIETSVEQFLKEYELPELE